MICSITPDLDAIGFKFGIAYDSPFGHRGFSHSIVFAALLASCLSLFAQLIKASRLAVWFFVLFSTLSHGMLDAMTNGGLGVAFFSPLSETRYFLPFQFIQVSPIGIRNFLTAKSIAVLQSEFLFIWLPCLIIFSAARLHKTPNKH